jgi:DNA-binding LacI/PurR family transcriptional regulator
MSDSWMRILEHVSAQAGPVSPTDVEAHTRIPPATVTRSLASLVAGGYLRRVGRGQYVLGERMKHLGQAAGRLRGAHFVFLQLFTASYDEIYAGVADVLGQSNSQCLVHPLCSSLEDDRQVSLTLPYEPPGIFFYSRWKSWAEASSQLGLVDVPAVHIGYPGYDACDTVSWDERDGFVRLTQALIDQGCPRAVYLGNRRLHGWDHSVRFRRNGYREAIVAAGLADEELIVGEDVGDTLRTCKRVAKLIGETDGPVGLVCDWFELLPGLAAGLDAAGMMHPDKLRIAGTYTREHAGRFAETVSRLSASIREPWHAAGQAAARRLVQRVEGHCSQTTLSLVRGSVDSQPWGP